MKNRDSGIVQELGPGLRGILAPNPGPMTYWGTNTFLVGDQDVAIIDPGPDEAQHLDAILSATKGAHISHILVTHAHLDHSPLAKRLAQITGAPIYGFGTAEAGRSNTMSQLATEGLSGGGEGVDHSFAPDIAIGDGDCMTTTHWSLDVLHTPGHFAGHLAFRFGEALLSGDHVMDWASSLVSPPDGDLTAFMSTSKRLQADDAKVFFPSHGGPIHDPTGRLEWLIQHRLKRESGILSALNSTPKSISEIAQVTYEDIEPAMMPAAERNVFAHLIDLVDRSLVGATPRLGQHAQFFLI